MILLLASCSRILFGWQMALSAMQMETNLDRLPPSATGSRVRLSKAILLPPTCQVEFARLAKQITKHSGARLAFLLRNPDASSTTSETLRFRLRC